MKKAFLSASILVASFAHAQELSFSASQLNFNDVVYPNKDSVQLDITNGFTQDIQVDKIDFFEKYGNKVFSVSEDQFTIPEGQSKSIWVYFEPEHNIIYNSEMVVHTDYRGAESIDLIGKGKFDAYYSSTNDKSDEDLKSALKVLLGQGYVSLGYSNGRNKMFMEFDNQKINGQGASVNTIECVYTGQLVTNYASRSDAQNQGFNTEHTFPQGMFNSNEPMKSDLHHLFPTNSTANSQRGNLPFGVVSGSSSWSVGGSKKGGGVFEPRDIHKGAVARAMMYFVLRYQDYNNFLSQQETVLRQWHYNDLPDQIDIDRNQAISLLQKNRNPFIDYPQLLERIHKISGNSVEPVDWGMYISDANLDLTTGDVTNDRIGHVVVANDGNQDIELESFSLSGNVEFVQTPTNVTILPGEAYKIAIRVVSGPGGLGELAFESNVPGQEDVSIPLSLPNVLLDNIDELAKSKFRVSPNPVANELNISFEGKGSVKVYSTKGELVYSKIVNRNERISVNNWSSGIYFVTLNLNNKLETISINVE